MTKKITYTDEPLGDIEVVADFLPFPAGVAFHEEGVKVTLALSKSSVDFFKLEAAKHQTQYRRMIRRLLDSYGEAHAPEPIRGRPKRSAPKRQAHTSLVALCLSGRTSLLGTAYGFWRGRRSAENDVPNSDA